MAPDADTERLPALGLLKGLSQGLFDQIFEYADHIRPGVTDESVAVMVLEIAFYSMALDPVIKKEIVAFLGELHEVVRRGCLKDMLAEDDFRANVAAYIRRGHGNVDFNAYALRQLINYLSYETTIYRKEK